MLTARDDKGSLVNLLEKDDISGSFSCPTCMTPVRLKKGRVMRAHFAHVSLGNCKGYIENESVEHLELKAALYRWGMNSARTQIEIESPLSAFQQIADLLVNERLALEVQCSSLSAKRLMERTLAYRKHGYQVLWLLGKNLWLNRSLTPLQKDFLYFSQNLGFYLWELDLEKRALRLKYLIHEDLHGHAQYKTKEFLFGQGDLLEVLRFPFKQQSIQSFLVKSDPQICHYIRQQLYFQNPKWMVLQAEFYQAGDNLLTKTTSDFYPQIKPVSKNYFCQITQDLTAYYSTFDWYYQQTNPNLSQVVYSPAFYQHFFEKLHKKRSSKLMKDPFLDTL